MVSAWALVGPRALMIIRLAKCAGCRHPQLESPSPAHASQGLECVMGCAASEEAKRAK